MEYTPQELNGVLFLIGDKENNRLNAEWERSRIQTWHLINLQLDKTHKITYDKFKEAYWPFAWEAKPEPVKREVDWDALDKREMELSGGTWKVL